MIHQAFQPLLKLEDIKAVQQDVVKLLNEVPG
jgi:hypothetical protein